MSGDSYEEVSPPATLHSWIRTLWIYRSAGPSDAVQRIAPDGCPELIIHLGEPYEEIGPDGAALVQPRALFTGQLTRPLLLRARGASAVIGVRFEPDGAADWFGRPMVEATDRRLDVTDRLGGLGGPMRDEGDPSVRVAAVFRWLENDRLRNRWSVDEETRAEVARCQDDASAQARSATERRRLQRRFERRVGVSPQILRSICRFRRVIDRIQAPDAETWLTAALDSGYFDQPQMARDFRRFLDCTATSWAREQRELAWRIASQPYKP